MIYLHVKEMVSDFMIKSRDKMLLAGVFALIFLLIMAMSGAAFSQESRAGEQNVLRRASLNWMQIGVQQYESKQFLQAEKSFRRALVFQKYLTDAERNQLTKYLANARIAISKVKRPVASMQTAEKSVKQAQPDKAAANLEKAATSQPPTQQVQQVKKVLNKTSSQPGRQDVQLVVAAKLSAPKVQAGAGLPGDIVVVKKRGSGSKFMDLSSWLSENRRTILMIGLPIFAVLVFIMKLQRRRKRLGRRVYENPALATSSFIGVRLNGGGENGRSAVAGSPKRKGFEQSTEHWKKQHVVQAPAVGKPFKANGTWPQREDKFEGGSFIASAGQKLCAKCNQLKPLGDFHKDKSSKDGLARLCKECKRQNNKNRPADKN
jgi:hypothetical protein